MSTRDTPEPWSLWLSSEDRKNSVQLSLIGTQAPQYPAAGLRVEVHDDGFRGENPDAWVDAATLDAFLAQLGRLEESRQGAAVLGSMSPRELHLIIESMDRAGHMRVRASRTPHHDRS